MYRTPDETPRCPCCHSLELSEVTKFDPSEGYARVHFEQAQRPSGLFADPFVRYTVNRARVCLACGHVMHFLDEKQRADLAERMASLRAIREE